MFRWLKRKKPPEEKLEPEDVAGVSRLLLPPDPPLEEKLAYEPQNTILQEEFARGQDLASGAGTSGGYGAFQPFLEKRELETRQLPESWEHDEAPETDAPQQVDAGEMREFILARSLKQKRRHRRAG